MHLSWHLLTVHVQLTNDILPHQRWRCFQPGKGIKRAFSISSVTASFWQIEFGQDVLLFHGMATLHLRSIDDTMAQVSWPNCWTANNTHPECPTLWVHWKLFNYIRFSSRWRSFPWAKRSQEKPGWGSAAAIATCSPRRPLTSH